MCVILTLISRWLSRYRRNERFAFNFIFSSETNSSELLEPFQRPIDICLGNVLHTKTQCSVTQYGVTQYSVTQCSVTQHSVTQYSVTQYWHIVWLDIVDMVVLDSWVSGFGTSGAAQSLDQYVSRIYRSSMRSSMNYHVHHEYHVIWSHYESGLLLCFDAVL